MADVEKVYARFQFLKGALVKKGWSFPNNAVEGLVLGTMYGFVFGNSPLGDCTRAFIKMGFPNLKVVELNSTMKELKAWRRKRRALNTRSSFEEQKRRFNAHIGTVIQKYYNE